MARLPRLTVPGYPHHIIQRGNNRQAIFSSTADYQMLLALIDESAHKFGVALHAYVLMGNHFHLLATPTTEEGLPQMMQAIGRRYVRYFNDRQARSGTLWEGRYRSTLIDTERYLLACMAYIDLNPVRAGLVQPRPPCRPAARSAHHAAPALLGAWQHTVCPRSGVCRTHGRRCLAGPARRADAFRPERLGAGG